MHDLWTHEFYFVKSHSFFLLYFQIYANRNHRTVSWSSIKSLELSDYFIRWKRDDLWSALGLHFKPLSEIHFGWKAHNVAWKSLVTLLLHTLPQTLLSELWWNPKFDFFFVPLSEQSRFAPAMDTWNFFQSCLILVQSLSQLLGETFALNMNQNSDE